MVQHDKTMHEALFRSTEQVLARQLATSLPAGLYLVATPIGNLADISLRALGLLANADIIYCEDKRHSSRLLNHYGIVSALKSYHEHNEEHERDTLLSYVENGKSVALISDAGTPLVSDPGCKLVVEAKERDLLVVAIPGASAPITALVSAGLPTDSFYFTGFLPPKKVARKKRLLEFVNTPATLIFFESPKRLKASLRDFVECYGARPAAIARELTKLHETVRTGSLVELAKYYESQGSIKGEIVILVGSGNSNARSLSDEELAVELAMELQSASLRDAVQAVCIKFDLPRSRVYNLAIKIKKTV
jgi:16S rRNA (cytidine1402-2'-O)-methyltransferase